MPYTEEQRVARRVYNTAWRARNPDKCRENNKRGSAKWKAANPTYMRTYARAHNLQKKYGLTVEQWETLFTAQGRTCAACGSDHPGGKYWHTDHSGPLPCRASDVRGILCLGCNHAAGKGDFADIRRLRSLADYLEERS